FPEVLTQSQDSKVAFVNLSGYPSPGWPKAGSTEGVLHENPDLTAPAQPQSFPTLSPPLALDVDGDGRCEVVAPNTSGILAALDASGHEVASFARSGQRADNLEVWEPGDLPAGLYLARLRFRAAGREEVQILPVGLIR